MGSDFTYVATTGTVIGVMAALTVVTGIINSLSTYWVYRFCRLIGLSPTDLRADREDNTIILYNPCCRARLM